MADRIIKRNFIELGCWILLLLGSFAFYSRVTHWSKAFGIALIFLLIYYGLTYLNRKILIPHLFNQSKFLVYMLSVLIIVTLVANLMARLDYLSVFDIKLELYTTELNAPQLILSRSSEQVKTTLILGVAFSVMLISLIYQLTLDYLKKQQAQLQLEREKQAAEMSYLKAQMHPHFFLNALNGLYALARLSPQKTGEYITKLAEMLSFLTYETNKETILLTQEIKYLKNYIYFQQYKEDTFQVSLEEKIDNQQFTIEPFLLIPFVENAFKHGYNGENTTQISINIQQKNQQLIFNCENPITKRNPTKNELKTGIGIENVKKRLQLKYPNQFTLKYGEKEATFKVHLILIKNG